MRKKTIEDYVELLYMLEQEQSPVHTNTVAQAFAITPASVTEMFQKLDGEDYIHYERYTGVTLTLKGKRLARATQQKHDILKQFLMLIGVDEKTADTDACRIEHIVTPRTLKKLTKFVEFAEQEHGHARWLDHFLYYDKTGKYITCTPQTQQQCPVHGKHKRQDK